MRETTLLIIKIMYAMFINILLVNKMELLAKQNIFINKTFKLKVRNFGVSQSD